MLREVPSNRQYDHAVPLKSGKLLFPSPPPTVLKKKTALSKAGEYLVRESKEELVLLLRTATQSIEYVCSPQETFKEEKFLWTWGEEKTEDIMDFFKNEAHQMCRHTQAVTNVDSREAFGVCTRTECELLKVEDLLMSYLTASLSPIERHLRYAKFINRFPPDKELVLYDPSMKDLQTGRLLLGGILSRTVRSIGNSNGTVYSVFTIQLNTDSKLEYVKNAFRPLALTGQRGSVRRNFTMKYVANSDSITLNDWYKIMTESLRGSSGNDRNKELESMYKNAIKATKDKQKLAKAPYEPTDMKVDSLDVYRDPRALNDHDSNEEIITKFKSPYTLEELYGIIIGSEKEPSSSFDKSLFGYIKNKDGSEIKECNVFSTPTNKAGSTLAYGLDYQNLLVSAVTDVKMDKPESYLEKAADFMKLLVNKQYSPMENLSRSFVMEKSFYVKYPESEESSKPMTEFAVIWNASAPPKGLAAAPFKGKVGGSGSVLDQVILQAQRSSSYSKDFLEYQECCLRSASAASSKYSDFVPDSTYPSIAGEVTDKEEAYVARLVQGTRDEWVLNALRYVRFVLGNGFESNNKSALYLQALDLVESCMRGCKNFVLVKMAFKSLVKLMVVGRYEKATFSIRSAIVNKACSVFSKVVNSAARINHDLHAVKVVELALSWLSEIILHQTERSCISIVNLDVVESIGVAIKTLGRLVTPNLAEDVASLKKSYAELEDAWFIGYSVLQISTRAKLFKKIDDGEDVTNDVFPYLENNIQNRSMAWKYARYRYDNESKKFVFHGNDGASYSIEEFKTLAAVAIPEKFKQVGYVDTSKCRDTGIAKVVRANVKLDLSSSSAALLKAVESAREAGDATSKVIAHLQDFEHKVNEQVFPHQSQLTLKIVGSAKRFIGTKAIYQKPELAQEWSKSIVDNVSCGLNSVADVSVDFSGFSKEKSLNSIDAARYVNLSAI